MADRGIARATVNDVSDPAGQGRVLLAPARGAGTSKFDGVVQCDTLVANSVVAQSYTPGAGNIAQRAAGPPPLVAGPPSLVLKYLLVYFLAGKQGKEGRS